MKSKTVMVHPIYGPIECTVKDGMVYDYETDTWSELSVESIYKIKVKI